MRYRKNYRSALKWSLAALILIIALPFVLGIANAWNESVAAQEVVAYNFDNSTAIDSYYTTGVSAAKVATTIIDNTNEYSTALAPFWNVEYNNESGWNEVFVNTGASSTDNTSAKNRLFFSMNVSAKEIVNENINKLRIAIDGLNPNTTAVIYIKIANITSAYYSSFSYSLKNGATGWESAGTANITENGTLRFTLNIDPAIASYIASKQDNSTWVTKIVLTSADPAHDIISEGNAVYFKIQYLKPHGRFVVNGVDFVDGVAEIYGIVFIFAAVFATGAVNPTKKHVFGNLYYGLKRYAKIRRKQKYRRARAKYYGSRRRYYRRWY